MWKLFPNNSVSSNYAQNVLLQNIRSENLGNVRLIKYALHTRTDEEYIMSQWADCACDRDKIL